MPWLHLIFCLLFVKSFEFVAFLGHEAMLRLAPNILIKKRKERENAKGRRRHWEWGWGAGKQQYLKPSLWNMSNF